MKYNVILADDEQLARKRLKGLLNKYENISIIAEAKNGIEAYELTKEHTPDFLFLDIEMPGLNGLEVSEKLGITKTKIIFITAYDEYALKSFKGNTYDYLVKPINEDRLDQTYKKLFGGPYKDGLSMTYTVKVGNSEKKILLKDILSMSAEGPYCKIKTNDCEYLEQITLEQLEGLLPSNWFLRIHRSYIIQVSKITKLERLGDRRYIIYLDGDTTTSYKVARSQISLVKSIIQK
jgi:DNA-binding LytR/AlgR family response regulator